MERCSFRHGGYYTKTSDNQPLIGPLPVSGAWVAGVYSGFGIMIAMAAGVLLCAYLCEQPLPEYAGAFSLDRFSDPSCSRSTEDGTLAWANIEPAELFMNFWSHLGEQITWASGSAFRIKTPATIAGGGIKVARRISGNHQDYFLKTNHAEFTGMFAAEAEALRVMAGSNTVRVPEPICYGNCGGRCYIVMEYLPLQGRADMALLGRQLAAMHTITSDSFGWHINNTIGLTPQMNSLANSWVDFWRTQRLGFQLSRAADSGYSGELQKYGERLLADFHVLFERYEAKASMLHGDLWAGNHGALTQGEPVIYDPAFYYGDRETDMAMTTLFGGYDNAFYSAYNETWPLDEGYAVRKTFYNIYHILNHLNLFGGIYEMQAISMIRQVLSEL